MIIDARQQFEDEPKSFGNKRHLQTDAHRAWIEQRYREGWADGYLDEKVKLLRVHDFAYHKVNVVFWQTNDDDKPAVITEKYEKAFTAANVAKEQSFYCRQPILLAPNKLVEPVVRFKAELCVPESGRIAIIDFTLDAAASFPKRFEQVARDAFAQQIDLLLKKLPKGRDEKKEVRNFLDSLEVGEVEFTHRHYIRDDEYIHYGEDIPSFLQREIAKPIIHWEDSPQLGYEIMPNKYFYYYQPPTPAIELLAQFWVLEKEAETIVSKLEQVT